MLLYMQKISLFFIFQVICLFPYLDAQLPSKFLVHKKRIIVSVEKMSTREYAVWCLFPTDKSRPFSVRGWKRSVLCGRKELERCFYPIRVSIFNPICLQSNFCTVRFKIFPVCTLTWRVNEGVSRQGESITKAKEKTMGQNNIKRSGF